MTNDKLVRQLETELHELQRKQKDLVEWLIEQRRLSLSVTAYKSYTHVLNYIAGDAK